SGVASRGGLVRQLYFPRAGGHGHPQLLRPLKFINMTTRVYPIHRAIGRPVVFKGFKGPYILMDGISLVADLLLFIILYVSGVAPWVCILLAFALGGTALATISKLSRRYGAFGLQPRMGT